MMVGRLCITGLCAFACFVAIKILPRYAQQSTTPLYSTFVTTLVVYLMTGAFMAVLVSQARLRREECFDRLTCIVHPRATVHASCSFLRVHPLPIAPRMRRQRHC